MKSDSPENVRLKASLRGAVQGVGFRPFVFRLAGELSLAGWVNNSAQGLFLEVEGGRVVVEEFLRRLQAEKPPQSFIQSLEPTWLDPVGYSDFQIRESDSRGEKSAIVMSDIATCSDCLSEIFDPKNRRYRYPFTNCTNCGPRFSIIESLPYDRTNTSMKRFTMCSLCQAEYDNPLDRRFHAQPNACPACGPQIELWNSEGTIKNARDALEVTADAIRAGQVVALKGLGGFHLLVAAHDDAAIRRLRERKHREEKPFAVMFPSVTALREVCETSPLEERLLQSPEAPILLLPRLRPARGDTISPAVAPGNPYLGVLLPYTPLHHLLLSLLQFPVVATSGNLSDEPICIDEREALERLRGIADLFLVHNRPIIRHVDDSIVRVMSGREMVLRRARGYAPLPILLQSADVKTRNESGELGAVGNPSPAQPGTLHAPLRTEMGPPAANVLAVGAHLKSAVALSVGPQIFISQHIGDLETLQAHGAFERVVVDLQALYDAPATQIAADTHPDYSSTRFAQRTGLPVIQVQHHVAHVLSCMAENELEPPALGVSWDGTGYGLDGTIWGGEFFRIHSQGFERVAHFRPFPLPGGDQAVREPRRSALGILFESIGPAAFERKELATLAAFSSNELSALRTMLERQLNSPSTSSVGRIFDAVASLAGLRQKARFEGQAAMDLEFLMEDSSAPGAYELPLDRTSIPFRLDWRPAISDLLSDLKRSVAPAIISARFHNMLVECIVQVAHQINLQRVVLSGGCFQNRYLTVNSVRRLAQEGFRPYWHQRVPPNDGGICLGQVIAARWWKV
jgi:hydrogenase maturation protein HypF